MITFDGFVKVYTEGKDDSLDEKKGVLPELDQDEKLILISDQMNLLPA